MRGHHYHSLTWKYIFDPLFVIFVTFVMFGIYFNPSFAELEIIALRLSSSACPRIMLSALFQGQGYICI